MDFVFYNGSIHTMDKHLPIAEALAIKDGVIFKVGSNTEILALSESRTKQIDLQGKCVVPGFNDSHMHLISYAEELSCVNLNGAKSIDEIKQRVKKYITGNHIPTGKSVIGNGWNQDYFAIKEFPTRCDLDEISTSHPILLNRVCYHIASANSMALTLAGIDKNTPAPEGGEILRDSLGKPTGVLCESAMELMSMAYGNRSVTELKSLILKAQGNLLRYGVTSVQTDDFSYGIQAVYTAYSELAQSGQLKIRINQQCLATNKTELAEILRLPQTNAKISHRYKLGPIKLLADGSLGARTAFLKEDYHDAPGVRGIPLFTQAQLDELVQISHNEGRQIAVHAIGDKAMEMVMNSFERANRLTPRKNHRHGIVHCQITDPALLQRMKRLNLLAYIQPVFLHYDLHIAEDRVGKEKASTSYQFKTLVDSGVPTSLGTDCPVEHFSPFDNIYCAVTRRDFDGYPEPGFYPKQYLSVHEAVRGYTVESAYASLDEQSKGSISAGKTADLVVLSQNIFAIPKKEIRTTEAVITVSGGVIVYQK